MPIRKDLDRLYWCFVDQPWMGAPDSFINDESATISFNGNSGMLWQPGSLGKYADNFGEELIEFWGIEPTRQDPQQLAADYCATSFGNMDSFVGQYARFWFLYTDSTCWECYARKEPLIAELSSYLTDKPWVEVVRSCSDDRGNAFAIAGLTEVWRALQGCGDDYGI